MKLIDAVNYILPKLGEHTVTSIEVKNPSVSLILKAIDQASATILARGWWFNTFDYTAYPNNEGEVSMGTATLDFVPTDNSNAVLRAGKLFNPETRTYVWELEKIEGTLTEQVEFEDLPESAAQVIKMQALVDMHITDLGVSEDTSAWDVERQRLESDLIAHHLRHKKYTTKKSPRYLRMRAAMRGT